MFFQVISAAYKTLSDANERAAFDRYGADGATQSRGGGHRGQHFHFDEDHINPDEIFNMFFGGGFPCNLLAKIMDFNFWFQLKECAERTTFATISTINNNEDNINNNNTTMRLVK